MPRHRGQNCALQKQRQKNIVRFRCGSPQTQLQSAFHRWFSQKDTAACLSAKCAVPQKILPPESFQKTRYTTSRNPLNRAPILAAPRLKRLCSSITLKGCAPSAAGQDDSAAHPVLNALENPPRRPSRLHAGNHFAKCEQLGVKLPGCRCKFSVA